MIDKLRELEHTIDLTEDKVGLSQIRECISDAQKLMISSDYFHENTTNGYGEFKVICSNKRVIMHPIGNTDQIKEFNL